jgi:hypothetical protein
MSKGCCSYCLLLLFLWLLFDLYWFVAFRQEVSLALLECIARICGKCYIGLLMLLLIVLPGSWFRFAVCTVVANVVLICNVVVVACLILFVLFLLLLVLLSLANAFVIVVCSFYIACYCCCFLNASV